MSDSRPAWPSLVGMSRCEGFSLLEVVVALMVLTIGLAGVVHSIGHGVAVAGQARRTRVARELVMERVLGVDAGGAGVPVEGWRDIDAGTGALCREREVSVGAEGAGGGAASAIEWRWVEVGCRPRGAPEGGASVWSPGRAGFLVAR